MDSSALKETIGKEEKAALSAKQLLAVGIALFTMFFGAGNLIFPPMLAYNAGPETVAAFVGFALSSVGLPIAGVVAVAKAGDLTEMGAKVAPWFSRAFTVLVVLSIGPLLAIPRTASTSFSMAVEPLVPAASVGFAQLAYTLVFFAAAFALALRPLKIMSILGRVTGPVLLVLIGLLFIGAVLDPAAGGALPVSDAYSGSALVAGFLDGYQTMDALAALLFGMIVVQNIKGRNIGNTVSATASSGAVTAFVLVVVYALLAFVGAWAAPYVPADAHLTGATLLSFAANSFYGSWGILLVGCVFVIACLNVCCSLLCTASEYFAKEFPRLGYRRWLVLFTVVSFAFANLGLAPILKISLPLLQVLYPVAIVLILLSFFAPKAPENDVFWRLAALSSLASSFVCVVFPMIPGLAEAVGPILAALPLHEAGLGWIAPTAVATGAGMLFCQLSKGKSKW